MASLRRRQGSACDLARVRGPWPEPGDSSISPGKRLIVARTPDGAARYVPRMTIDGKRDRPASTLPAYRAFVVHFGTATRRRRRFTGRVEHLASGAIAHFASLRGLLTFVTRRLDPPGDP